MTNNILSNRQIVSSTIFLFYGEGGHKAEFDFFFWFFRKAEVVFE
jgi:hypothetical protein